VFRFQRGPVFTQVLLADEINRALPKTQSALLEAMQERAVTFAGQQHLLPQPFFVLATQNPIEQAGTDPLPERSCTSLLLRIEVGYPSEAQEVAMVARTTHGALAAPPQVLDVASLLALQRLTKSRPSAMAWRTTRAWRDMAPVVGGGGCSPARALGGGTTRRPSPGDGGQGARPVAASSGRHTRRHCRHADARAGAPRAAQFEAEADGVGVADIVTALQRDVRPD